MARRGRDRSNAAPVPSLEDILGDGPLPMTPNPSTRRSSRHGSVTNFARKEEKPIEQAKSSGSIVKPKEKVYKQEDVENLPQKLEKQISDLHTSIAQTLINKSSILQNSTYSLKEISSDIKRFLSRSKGKEEVNAEAYKKLCLINSDHKVSQLTISNKRKVIDQFQIILEKMQIPDNWKAVLTQPRFDVDQIKNIYHVLQEATEAMDDAKTPPELVGLLAAKERQRNIQVDLKFFTNNFVNFFKDTLQKPNQLEEMAKHCKKIENIPREDIQQEEVKKFSLDVSDHLILQAIYPYSSIIIWIKKNDEQAYGQLVQAYYHESIAYTENTLKEIITHACDQIKSFKPPETKTELFAAGENIKSPEAKQIWEILDSTSERIFHIISIEKVILQEYWKTSNPSYLNNILQKETINQIEQMWHTAQKFDKFFLLRGMSLNYHMLNEKHIPLESLIESLTEKWENYMQSQIDLIQTEKVNPKKTSVLSPFKHFPAFIVHILSRKRDYDQEIIDDIFERFVSALESWIVDVVGPKTEKKKRERLIVVNINYIIAKLAPRDSIQKNENMVQVLNQAKEFRNEHINLLLKELVRKTWKNAYTFFNQITEWKEKCGLTAEVVTFQPTHTDEKFQELIDELNKTIRVNCDSCIEVLKNKIKDQELRDEIIQALSPYLEQKWNEWDSLARECYEMEIKPSVAVVRTALSQSTNKDVQKKK